MKILDLYCGAGGAAMGLHQAFPDAEIIGVDIVDQPNYPFKFYRGDVKKYAIENSNHDFAWASPVCKRYTGMTNCRKGVAATHPDDIAFIRAMLRFSGKPFVIENVVGAPLHKPVMLCGRMFGLDLYRHRLFESNFPINVPSHPAHDKPASRAGHWTPGTVMSVAGHFSPVSHAKEVMGIDWMTRDELSQAIPPAYSKYIGEQFKEANMQCWHKEINDEGFCKECGERAAVAIDIPQPLGVLHSEPNDNPASQRKNDTKASVPDCSTCGRPSPEGDPCLTCRASWVTWV